MSTYVMKPSPGFDGFGRCLGCGQHSTTTAGHMCMVRVGPEPRKRTFVVTIEEVDPNPYQGFQTTTHPGYEVIWENPVTTFC